MSYRKRRIRLIFRLLAMVTAVNLVVALIAWSLMRFVWPESYFNMFPVIPVYFWLVGLGMALCLEFTRAEKPDAIALAYMVARGVKLLVTAIFIGGYAWLIHTDFKEFGLTTLAFYMIYLVLETYTFFLYEKRLKKRRRAKEGNKIPEPEAYSAKEIEKEDIDA
ncbi:MAG: hypothetical protein Q8914_09345 [Bacteroidota bacterium]|nr:hypothetical protein [Bacteroidota bacterium]